MLQNKIVANRLEVVQRSEYSLCASDLSDAGIYVLFIITHIIICLLYCKIPEVTRSLKVRVHNIKLLTV